MNAISKYVLYFYRYFYLIFFTTENMIIYNLRTSYFMWQTQAVSEIHAVISSSKPMITWTARDAIQEAREACGGHGYLKASKLGDLRNDHDPSLTYEGDNNVLGQQASNWLLRQWNEGIESPVGTANFLKDRDNILKQNWESVLKQATIDSFECMLSLMITVLEM